MDQRECHGRDTDSQPFEPFSSSHRIDSLLEGLRFLKRPGLHASVPSGSGHDDGAGSLAAFTLPLLHARHNNLC